MSRYAVTHNEVIISPSWLRSLTQPTDRRSHLILALHDQEETEVNQ